MAASSMYHLEILALATPSQSESVFLRTIHLKNLLSDFMKMVSHVLTSSYFLKTVNMNLGGASRSRSPIRRCSTDLSFCLKISTSGSLLVGFSHMMFIAIPISRFSPELVHLNGFIAQSSTKSFLIDLLNQM